MEAGSTGKLFLVPTPIGNLEDITLRAIKVLQQVDAILAEDTRTSGNLLRHLVISKPLYSNHLHNEHQTLTNVIEKLKEGQQLALVSDAGTPAISDPGFLLVRGCIAAGIAVECLPGPTAFVPALVNSGLPCDRFTFEGFLPVKKGRKTRIEELGAEERTMIFYESPFRLIKTLEELAQNFGADRKAAVSRELTKMYEENKTGTLSELAEYFSAKTIKGEIVLVVEGKKEKKESKNTFKEGDDNE